MAELRESLVDPVDLVNKLNPNTSNDSSPDISIDSISKIPANLVRFVDNTDREGSDDEKTDISEQDEDPIPDKLDDYYMSLSDMMETVHTDHLLLSKSINDISHTIATVKLDIEGMRDTYSDDVSTIKKEIASLKRMIHDNRNTFLMALDQNIKAIKVRLDKLEKRDSP